MAGQARTDRPPRALLARLRQVAEAVEAPLLEAQDRAHDAMQAGTASSRLALAAEALGLSPLAADAWVVLAGAAPEGSDLALQLWRQAVAAGTLAIGPEAFTEMAGEFWLALETRPYMRARCGLGLELWRQGQRAEAIAELSGMLRLNPNDNQGMRYALIGWLLTEQRDAEAAKLLAAYPEDAYAGWPYAEALLAFRREGDQPAARAALARAVAANPHLPPLLLGRRPMPKTRPWGYSPGSPEEAVFVAEVAIPAWETTPGALDWLGRQVANPEPKSGKARHARR